VPLSAIRNRYNRGKPLTHSFTRVPMKGHQRISWGKAWTYVENPEYFSRSLITSYLRHQRQAFPEFYDGQDD